jgi:hypothetical protein
MDNTANLRRVARERRNTTLRLERNASTARLARSADRQAQITALEIQLESIPREIQRLKNLDDANINSYGTINSNTWHANQTNFQRNLEETHRPIQANLNAGMASERTNFSAAVERRMANANFLARHPNATNDGRQFWAIRELEEERKKRSGTKRAANHAQKYGAMNSLTGGRKQKKSLTKRAL